jgi:hypothetical protein
MVLGDVRGAVAPLRECVVNLDAQGDLPMLGGTVPGVALVFAGSGRHEAALVCSAVLSDGAFSQIESLMHESIAADYDSVLVEARSRLGPEVSAAAAARGAAMEYHEAVAFLLAELDAAAEL